MNHYPSFFLALVQFGVIIYTVDTEMFEFLQYNTLPLLCSDCTKLADSLSQSYDFSSL